MNYFWLYEKWHFSQKVCADLQNLQSDAPSIHLCGDGLIYCKGQITYVFLSHDMQLNFRSYDLSINSEIFPMEDFNILPEGLWSVLTLTSYKLVLQPMFFKS